MYLEFKYFEVWPIVVTCLILVEKEQQPLEKFVYDIVLILILHVDGGQSNTIQRFGLGFSFLVKFDDIMLVLLNFRFEIYFSLRGLIFV